MISLLQSAQVGQINKIRHFYDNRQKHFLFVGVGNSSESVYIRTFVHYAQCHGYRIAVLNHIGVIDSIKVTSHRIFSYGK